jgi:hypothetical protein
MRPNIDNVGRAVRGLSGLVLLLVGVFVFGRTPWLGVVLFLIGAFCIFEALRGWCALRACGVKTKF